MSEVLYTARNRGGKSSISDRHSILFRTLNFLPRLAKEAAAGCRRLVGYDDVWLTEHHFADDGQTPSPLIQAAAIAMRTKKIRIGTAVIYSRNYHPVRVAEDCATIDVLSSGRFELASASAAGLRNLP
jgi:alkanesulfonate monooxygenase SsuD/methylene tetrahydromethanopterin reductase-like flavin-dependent oxidoreductase (luciferase family)